jgi:hypothetical protein
MSSKGNNSDVFAYHYGNIKVTNLVEYQDTGICTVSLGRRLPINRADLWFGRPRLLIPQAQNDSTPRHRGGVVGSSVSPGRNWAGAG